MDVFLDGSAAIRKRFLSSLVRELSLKRLRYRHRIGLDGFVCEGEPKIRVSGPQVEWIYLCRCPALQTTYETRLVFEWLAGEESEAEWDFFSDVKAMSAQFSCSCERGRFEFCEHLYRTATLLLSKLNGPSSKALGQWIAANRIHPRELGESFLKRLEQACDVYLEVKSRQEFSYELQWWLSAFNSTRERLQIAAKVRRKPRTGQGRWSHWRHVAKLDEEVIDFWAKTDRDRLLSEIVGLQKHYGSWNANGLISTLKLLVGRDDVYWSDGRNIQVSESTPEVQIEEREGYFRVVLSINGQPLVFGNKLDKEGNAVGWSYSPPSLVFFQIPEKVAKVLQVLSDSSQQGALFRMESALKLKAMLEHDMVRRHVVPKIAEQLVAPEVALAAQIQLHLEPYSPCGLRVKLRVECDAANSPLVPGLEPSRLFVTTPAGPVQYVRDLMSETERAGSWIELLGLGSYAYDGPYTWLVESDDQALELVERAAQLAPQGLEVCWPKSKPMRFAGDIDSRSLKVQIATERDWFGMHGELDIDGIKVSLIALLAAIRRGGQYVRLSEGTFARISQTLRRRLMTIDALATTENGKMRIARVGAMTLNETLGTDIPLTVDKQWRDAIQCLTSKKGIPSKPPKGFKAQLRNYQWDGYLWLAKMSRWGLGACLADDMGLGKTVQALAVLVDRAASGPALIIAPTSVGVNWLRESERFAPTLKPYLYRDHDREQLVQKTNAGDLVITSYSLLQRDVARFASRQWGTLILDESQYIKNFFTKTNQAVRQIQADWTLAISGTPMENHLGELWALMRVLCPGLLGSWDRFRQKFADPIERARAIGESSDRLEVLSQLVRPFILRRTKQEVLSELPGRTEVVLGVDLSSAERSLYESARLAALHDLSMTPEQASEGDKRFRVLSWLTRLRLLACHPKLVDSNWKSASSKLKLLLETIDELKRNGHRALVFSQFVKQLAIVRNALDQRGIQYEYLDGSTTVAMRQAAVDRFQSGQGDLFLISLKAGGTGLNLTAADYVLHLDPWWNPAVEDQATDRAHRIGQHKNVTVYRLVTRGTIEEQILELHQSKRELTAGVLGGSGTAARLSTEELITMIRDNHVMSVSER